MSSKTLDCAEIRNGFTAGRVPTGPEVDLHLSSCAPCRDLFEKGAQLGQALAVGATPEVGAAELWAQVESRIEKEKGLRATLRALPSVARASVLLAVAGTLVSLQLAFHRRADYERFSPFVFWLVAAALGVGLVLGVWRLLVGATAPMGVTMREAGRSVALLLLPAGVVFVVPLGAERSASASEWGDPMGCFGYGGVLVAPFLLLCWAFERRDRIPTGALVSAGALAGITANLLLHAHCGSAHLGHLLLGHASIGAALAVMLLALSRPKRLSR